MATGNGVGVIVPTLGSRPKTLRRTLVSIRGQVQSVSIVAPKDTHEKLQKDFAGLFDYLLEDPNKGLSAAINHGFKQQNSDIIFTSWLGDDDYLEPNSVSHTLGAFESNPGCSAVYGKCNYVDEHGTTLFSQNTGNLAKYILEIGPDLVPQPGSIIRAELLREVGYLDESLKLAFDYDMFLRLKKRGKLVFVNETLANFTWHGDSLSVRQRGQSLKEAKLVRRKNAKSAFDKFALVISPVGHLAAVVAGKYANYKSSRIE